METDPVIEKWLQDFSSPNTVNSYRSAIKRYLDWNSKTARQLLDEAHSLRQKPGDLNLHVFQFYQALFTQKAQKTGSIKGSAGGVSGEYKDKILSQMTARFTITVVQSFYAAHGFPVSLRRWRKKYARMVRPRVERKKYQLTVGKITKLFQVSDPRDRALISLGFMGLDEATVSELRTEQFNGRLRRKT